MARSSGKKPVASTNSTPAASSAASNSTVTLPEPFTTAPPALAAKLLSRLPLSHIYILHTDNTPPSLKRSVFLVPVLLNIVIFLVLCVRVYFAAPNYLELIITTFGYDTASTVDTAAAGLGDIATVVTSRTALLMADYALFALLGSWPWQFLFGAENTSYTGPLSWRLKVNFQPSEIIIRRSRKWDRSLLKTWTLDDELTVKRKLQPAVAKAYISKTGYALLDKDWDLDFGAMVLAHKSLAKGELSPSDFANPTVAIYYHPLKSWLTWQPHASTPSLDPSLPTVELDPVLAKFKTKLFDMEQRDVFYRYIEIIQYETSVPGGLTMGGRARAMREARRIFTDAGVDFDRFWTEIGGDAGMPGLEVPEKNWAVDPDKTTTARRSSRTK